MLLILAAIGVGHVAVILGITGSMVLPNPLRQLQNHGGPEKFGLEPEGAVIGDGSPAWYFENPTATHAVLVSHGRSRSKNWMLPLIAVLARKYTVLAIDFPSHGDNKYGTTTVGLREARTVTHALDWLRRRGHDQVLMYGVSMGGAASLIALGNDCPPHVKAVVTDGTFDTLPTVIDNVARWLPMPGYLHTAAFALTRRVVGSDPAEVRPVHGVAELQIPALFLHGDRDPLVPVACSDVLAACAPNGEAQRYPGRHDQPDNEAMHQAVLAFFERVT